jgi:hypothetical protein
MQEELVKLENDFARAVANNDGDALDGILADDWIMPERWLSTFSLGGHESHQST